MSRYSRHSLLDGVGTQGQEKLQKAKVLVVGAGGLGCPVLQYLAAAGIGTLGIIDFDVVEISNLQRQILFGQSSLGKNKAIAAKKRLEDLNSEIVINAYPKRLTTKNALALFKNYHLIVDGTDNFASRYLINDACVILNKPLVYAAIYKFEGQVCVFNFQNGPNYRHLFPVPPKAGSVANCSQVGVLGVLPGIIGSMQANEVLKIVIDLGDVLSGRLLCYNSKTAQSEIIKLNNSTTTDSQVPHDSESFENFNYQAFCGAIEEEILAKDVLAKEAALIIDVRELEETPKVPLTNQLSIPLSQLKGNLNKIPKDRDIVFYCQTGVRSAEAVAIFKTHSNQSCYSLQGGAKAILSALKEKPYERQTH